MITKLIRWRLQLWLAFLLASVLAGFGAAVYQLQRLHQLSLIDEELDRRVAVLVSALRPSPPRDWGHFDGRHHGPGGTNDPFGQDEGRGGSPGDRQGLADPAPPAGRFGPGPGQEPDRWHGPGSGDGPGRGPGPTNASGGSPGWPRAWGKGPGFPFSEWAPDSFPHPHHEFPPSAELLALMDQTPTNRLYNTIWYNNGKLLRSSTNTPPDLSWPKNLAGSPQTRHRTRSTFREAVHFTELGDCVVAGCSLGPYWTSMLHFAWLMSLAGGAVLLAGLAGSWWLVGRAIRPIAQISAAASRISAGNLSERIDADETESEFGRLTSVLNSTFARLEAAFAQQTNFVADASHELRTPLAVLISDAQTTLARDRSAAEYRETVESCLQTAQQMRRLADSLLELARFDSGEERLQREVFDLSQVVRHCLEFVRPLADARGIRIHSEMPFLQCLGDPDRIGQVLVNLLSNAIHFNRDHGEIHVSARAGQHQVTITVADTGEGIPPEALPHLFERFYRVDKSRSRSRGGTGLGLAISKAIVDAHGGALRAASEPGVGSTFTLQLPLNE